METDIRIVACGEDVVSFLEAVCRDVKARYGLEYVPQFPEINGGYSSTIYKLIGEQSNLCLKLMKKSTEACKKEHRFYSIILGHNDSNMFTAMEYLRKQNLNMPTMAYASLSGRYFGNIQRYLNLFSIQEIIKRGIRVSERHAATFLKGILNGIDKLHNRHYTHRDLFPGNIMLDDTGGTVETVVIDFADAEKVRQGLKPCFLFSGYHAPEIVNRNGDFDEKAEIFSVGIILWELIYGSCPFAGYRFFGEIIADSWECYMSNSNYYNEKTKQELAYLERYLYKMGHDSSISNECRDLLMRLLNPDREHRLSTCEALCHPFLTKREKLTRGQLLEIIVK